MNKKFNITGTCIPHVHYMADTGKKIEKIILMIEAGEYFTINRPRQYGKTTTMYLTEKALKEMGHYIVLKISFEDIDTPTYARHERFIPAFLDMLKEKYLFWEKQELADFLTPYIAVTQSMSALSKLITQLVSKTQQKTVLMIDEVDKSSNNQLFLDFLGMLRTKYLKRNEGEGTTFHAVILAGVHDVKSLKAKISKDEKHKFNSPWNIAVDFKVDLSLFPEEIAPMLAEYAKDKNITIDIPWFSEQLFYYTAGYPFLVSQLCKTIDEELLPTSIEKIWSESSLITAIQIMLKADATNFDSLIGNLENNQELYELVHDIIIKGIPRSYNKDNPVIAQGTAYGIFREDRGQLKIHNRIYEQRIYNYMTSKSETPAMSNYNFRDNFIEPDNVLNIKKIIMKFQVFMREQYSRKDEKFLERNGRLLFLAFLKPIINGRGFDFKEVEISEEKRLDIIVTYLDKKYIIELKRWQGQTAHQKGLQQLADYLERQHQQEGFLIIYDFRKGSSLKYTNQNIEIADKTIFMAWV